MLNRRCFLAASVMAAVAPTLPVQAFAATPLRATPKHRRLFPKREEGGSWLFHSDGPYEPRKVIRPDIIERVFGEGAFNRLSQRDHWAMIEAGWFSGSDLHLPVPLGDPTYDVWKGYYHPVTEAHDLLRHLFAGKYSAVCGGGVICRMASPLPSIPAPRAMRRPVSTMTSTCCAACSTSRRWGRWSMWSCPHTSNPWWQSTTIQSGWRI
jgi:hypothetical protein